MEQPQQEFSEPSSEHELGFHPCATHPDVETGLSCGKCGKYICPRCVIQTPVGGRCSDCAMVKKVPIYDVQPTYYLRASLAGGIVAVVGGIVWGLLWPLGVPFLPWILAIGVAYLVGEAISVAANRKRGQGLSVIAGLSMTLAVVISGFLPSLSLSTSLLSVVFWLLIVGAAFYTAISRVR